LTKITFPSAPILLRAAALLAVSLPALCRAQQPRPPAESKPAPAEKNAAQIELLETTYRFEPNGDSRKEVHTRVHINNEIGARQFARLHFDFNRSFQAVEIPLVRVTHASGGTADILPSAITEGPGPAVVDFPDYQQVRVKSVRILGLAPGDLLEYRIVTTTTHHPLAPDYWLDHSFDRSGVVSEENFAIDLPAVSGIRPRINPETPPASSPQGAGEAGRVSYVWHRKAREQSGAADRTEASGPDVSLSTFKSWSELARRLSAEMMPSDDEALSIREKASAISRGIAGGEAGAIYDFVSEKIKTVDVPLDATGFRRRKPAEILESGYGTAEDKFVLFAALLRSGEAGFVADSVRLPDSEIPSPGRFSYLLTFASGTGLSAWLDLNAEVAPLGMIPAQFRGRAVLLIGREAHELWQTVTPAPLYKPSQQVTVAAKLAADGILSAKVHYTLRGDNELLLRVAFHQTPKEKWKDVAQMLSLSDGFRGQITSVTASDPSATKEPFQVEYEISQPKFADWSRKTVRIPAILPLPGLPDPASAADAQSTKPLQLGTPLAIDLEATLELPEGSSAAAPIGTTVNRDYATFSSKYSAQGNHLRASRNLHFLLPELPGSRATDLNAFLHAVQSDQVQFFTVQPPPQK
jgi:hypothetical protein